MRLFTSKASKSSKPSNHSGRKAVQSASRVVSTRDSMFEPLEGREMFSVSAIHIVGPIIPIIPIFPTLTNAAITAEYVHTASETDAYGTKVQSLLGSATSDVEYVPGVSGAEMQSFHDNGVIYWSASTGAHVVFGGIGGEYANLANETDAYGRDVQLLLGLPTSDETNLPGVAGARTNTFQYGSIDWSASTGAHIVYGGIGGEYNSLGGPTSWLGLPTSDESGPQTDRVADFQDGYISWSPTGGSVVHETSVTIGTRYGSELVVTENGLRDSVMVVQSGSTLDISANGQVFYEPCPADGLFVYSRGGADNVYICSSVSDQTTVDTIDGAHTNVWAFGSHNIVWADSTDSVSSTGPVHSVSSFAGGVSKALGAHLACPSDSGSTFAVSASLFGKAPVAADVNQGSVGDCYFVATLAAFAQHDPGVILNSAVDLGDGTYAVEFYKSGTPEFIRVDNRFASGPWGGYNFAHPGTDGDIWAPVMEKAFAYFRSGANTYASISGGWPTEVYADLNQACTSADPNTYTASALYSRYATELSEGKAITLCTPGTVPNLVGDHCYTLMSVEIVGGQYEFTVRNPWGFSGDKLENSQGIATLTYNEVISNFDSQTCAS